MNNYQESKGYYYSFRLATLLTMDHCSDFRKLDFARKKAITLLETYIENHFFKDENVVNYNFYKIKEELLITSTNENLIKDISIFGKQLLENKNLFNLAYNFVLKDYSRKQFYAGLDTIYTAFKLEQELPNKIVIKNKTNKL